MGGNVQCPVCTLFLLPGMNLSDHLETHPKEQVIKALVQMSLKTETSDASLTTTPPETSKKPANKSSFPEPDDSNSLQATEDERISPVSEMSVGSVSDSLPSMVEPVHAKRTDKESNNKSLLHNVARPANISSLNRQTGYVFENNTSSSNSSSNQFFGPPTPFYHHPHPQPHQQQQQQQHQPQSNHHQHQLQQHQQNHHQQSSHQHQQQQQHQQNPNHNYPSYHGIPSSHAGNNNFTGHGPTHPPMRLFSYQPTPKPLQPPPAYGAAISQLRSQNSQNLMSNSIHRPLYPPGNYTLPSAPAASAPTSASTPSRLPPPLPPPPLNQRYQSSNFDHMDAAFNETDDTGSAISPRRTTMTPPTRPPPQLYRSPQSASNVQFSRQSSSPYSIMSGSPSVLRFAESPVTAHYLERENGDFIVQETPKHVVECVEKDDGEFSVIERVYHMPPSVVQVNEDDEEDNLSEHASISSEDVKLAAPENERPNNSWTTGGSSSSSSSLSNLSSSSSSTSSSNQGQGSSDNTIQQPIKKSSITVLSDVQLDLSEYLDLVGNIIASGKVAKNRSELIKIEKLDPEEVKEEEPISLEDDEEEIVAECIPPAASIHASTANVSNFEICAPAAKTSVASSGTTSVIRLAATCSVKSSSVVAAAELAVGAPKTKTIEQLPIPTKIEDNMNDDSEDGEEKPSTSLMLELESTSNSKSTAMDLEIIKTASTLSTATNKTDEAIKASNLEAQAESLTTKQLQSSDEEAMATAGTDRKDANLPTTSSNSFQSTQKRPIKKGPKKLIIKPKNKTSTSTTQAMNIDSTPSTSTDTKPKPASEPKQTERVAETDDSLPRDELRSIKVENVSCIASDPILFKPLLADDDEKLPPEDDAPPQPSTSSAVPEREKRSNEKFRLGRPKPPADLTAFIDECLKKEVEEEEQDHPMHSIFGMDIRATEQILNSALTATAPTPTEFPSSSSLFAKPLTSTTTATATTTTSDNLTISESMIIDGNNMHESNDHQLQHDHQYQQQPHQQQQQQSNSNFVEYPFSFLYGGDANHQDDENKHNIPAPIYCTEDFNKYSASTSGGNSASCTWYQSQSSENDFEVDGKGSYLDLDSCKRSNSFAAATEGSMPTSDALNIRTDEKMPAKGEISEQESNCGVENSWSQPLYNEFAVRFPNPYQNFMANNESWSQEHYFRPQDLSSSVETKNFPLRSAEEPSAPLDTLPSTSKRKIAKIPRKKNFQCTHCNTHFPLLKEKNAHMIKQHGYKRVNRRLIRDPPTSTVTTATLNSSATAAAGGSDGDGAPLLLGLDGNAAIVGVDEDSKAAIVKIEQENQEPNKNKNAMAISSDKVTSSSSTSTAAANASRTKYDSMRARDNRMLINFNLSALNVKNEGTEVHSYYLESKSSFCCFVCKRDFLTVKLFDEHLVEHPAECFTCHKKFTRWKNFMVHLKRHLGWKDFACTYCEKKFVIRSALVEHMRMHTGQTPLKCKVCGKSFKRYSNLTQHRKRHGTKINRSKEYVCFCGEVLPSKARFIWHKETHDLKPKCCPYCRDRFVHANSLRRHIRLAHSDKFDYTEPMECPMCKQIYAKSSIKAHMATHSMDTQHECLICSKSFSTKWNLKIHNWVHANRTTKPFKCEQCVKAFVREVDYNNHINSHKQIKPYTCEHCGCKFIRKYNYIRHRREHHGNKKFTCDLCGKLFHRHYYLIEHRRIHTGERPFQCTICGKSSTTKTNHNKHLKIHHSRDPFTSEA